MTFSLEQAAPEISGSLERGFLLVEPAMLAHSPDLAALKMNPCVPRALAHREELMPRLIDVAALDDDARARATECWMAELCAERPPVACAWLDSEADVDATSAHIASALVAPGAEGGPVYWRYYDPRVLPLVLAVIDRAQRQALLGPIRAWQFAWAGYRWCVTSAGTQPALPDQVRNWPRPEQWARINRSEAADRVLRRLPSLSMERAARLPATLDQTFSEVALTGDALDIDASVALVSQRLRHELGLDDEIQGSKR